MDAVEIEYERAITEACRRGQDDEALELSIGLAQYRDLYKSSPTPVAMLGATPV